MSIIKYKMKKIILAGIVVLSAACQNIIEHQGANSYTLLGDTILIDDKSTLLRKLRIDTIKPEPYRTKLLISGIVRAIPNNYAEVASPFAGRITKSFVRLGPDKRFGDTSGEGRSDFCVIIRNCPYDTRNQ